ncbi:MAG: phosphoribosyl-ATP diphosphatase [Chloroflexi bacterium]|nr:phosphoribosyl-ATP diphosphatase [Chloroflexota bacterium]
MSFLHTLFQTIQDRKKNPKAGSYTNTLFEMGEDEIIKKVGEDAVEIILAAKGQGDQRLIEESADLMIHLLVLLAHKGLTLDDVERELERRHKK